MVQSFRHITNQPTNQSPNKRAALPRVLGIPCA